MSILAIQDETTRVQFCSPLEDAVEIANLIFKSRLKVPMGERLNDSQSIFGKTIGEAGVQLELLLKQRIKLIADGLLPLFGGLNQSPIRHVAVAMMNAVQCRAA